MIVPTSDDFFIVLLRQEAKDLTYYEFSLVGPLRPTSPLSRDAYLPKFSPIGTPTELSKNTEDRKVGFEASSPLSSFSMPEPISHEGKRQLDRDSVPFSKQSFEYFLTNIPAFGGSPFPKSWWRDVLILVSCSPYYL